MASVDEAVLMKKGGSFLRVPQVAVSRYMAKGYDVVDENGNILEASIPNDLVTLRAAYQNHLNEIAALKKRIGELEKNLQEQKPAIDSTPKASVRKTKKS